MSLTKREIILLLFFPVFIVSAIYFVFFGKSTLDRLSGMRRQLVLAQAEAVSPMQLNMVHERLTEIQEEIQAKRIEQQQLVGEAEEVCGQLTAGRRDIESIDRLTAILAQHNLKLTDERPASGQQIGGMVAGLEGATNQLRKSVEAERIKGASESKDAAVTATVTRRVQTTRTDEGYRSLQFYGSYLNVLAALDELSRGDGGAIPVSISMQEIGAESLLGDQPFWTLVVRM